MSPTPSQHSVDHQPGQLLDDLERRQDEVLLELDALDRRLAEVLSGLGVSCEEEAEE